MRRDKFVPIFFLSLILFFTSFILGYQLMRNELEPKDRISELDTENNQKDDYSDLEILKEDNRISPNTFIEERVHYRTCDHVITKVKKVEDEFVNMTREEFEKYIEDNYTNQRIISFSTTKITLGINKNHLCENHYVVGEEDGKIAIFKIDENGNKVLDKVFDDYPISLLMEVDQERLIEGIVVDSEEELSNVLENFISWLS